MNLSDKHDVTRPDGQISCINMNAEVIFPQSLCTLTFCPSVRATKPGCDSASRFCCWTALPISATKCVLRCRRSSVLLAGMDSSVANNSAPKRGSSTWIQVTQSAAFHSINQPINLLICLVTAYNRIKTATSSELPEGASFAPQVVAWRSGSVVGLDQRG